MPTKFTHGIAAAAIFMAAIGFVCSAATANATTLDWSFDSFAGLSAHGELTINAEGEVVALTGFVGGQPITLYVPHGFSNPNPDFPGAYTLPNAPNTHGASYTYDDYFSPLTGVDSHGILFSTGTGNHQVFYDLKLDTDDSKDRRSRYRGDEIADLVSFNKKGVFVDDDGTIDIYRPCGGNPGDPPLATPLPASWLLMITGFAGFGFFAYRARRESGAAAASGTQ
jgi:hypothetical protein